ncbi:FH2 domain-containing protein 1 [Caerostris extrusa]|uniref:FH2 domain-containing protein 1 n=1 Tax=Caerostris extrusa TaxID=172846 RepID=A0AAV4M431_CAEEX|nr:FH2 domain-containing protein 1 [Caerostris extrusa]
MEGTALTEKKRESSEINLLDGKRSLNVNIFLKQFRSSNDEIIDILKRGAHEEIGAEKLRGLLKILPESDEIELLRSYSGDRPKLGNAEKFLLQLIELPNYKLRCEGMLLKRRIHIKYGLLGTSYRKHRICLKHCQALHEVLYMLLVAGNFLNSGGYAGDAAGFKMMSLLKIAETRANKPGMNLVHYVAQEAENKFPNLLKFPEYLPNLEEASKLSIDNLKSEITNLSNKVSKISQQVATSSEDVKKQMEEFLEFARREVMAVQKEIEGLEKVREDMAEFLCEELQSFKLEECFKIFHGFCQKFKASIEENEKRRQQEKRAEVRRKQREEQLLKKKTSGETRPSSFSGSESDNVIDMLLGDIRGGFNRFVDNGSLKSTRGSGKPKRSSPDAPVELCRMNSLTSSVPSEDDPTASPRIIRRRIGSSNSVVNGSGGDIDGFDTQSPDVTPNGTLRRRRHRLSSEDKEDSLIDFLRQTADADAARTEKGKLPESGSLDRSMIRRSSRRRRPDLSAVELIDRERPASPGPSPLLERRSVALDPDTNKPKQWRIKIEEWLQENEKEQAREKKLREKIALERWKRQEMEQREADNSSSPLDKSNERKSPSKNLETLIEAKTDSEIYANKKKDSGKTQSTKKSTEVAEGTPLKDKSKWRKSTLNVANSSESIDDERRRNRSRKPKSDAEEEDTISFYIRSPEITEVTSPKLNEYETTNKEKETFANKPILENPVVPVSFEVQRNVSNSDSGPSRNENIQESFKETNEIKQIQTPQKLDSSSDGVPNEDLEVTIGRSRFYQSMKEPSLNKTNRESNKNNTLDDQVLNSTMTQKSLNKYSVDDTEKLIIGKDPKVNSLEKDEEGNFDRFSFMRKTTRRTKPRHKVSDSDTKNMENQTVNNDAMESKDATEYLQQFKPEVVIKTDKENVIEAIPVKKETLNLAEEKNKNRGLFTKNVADNNKIQENNEDTKKKDKFSTSLKARLSKRLLSLTENLKVGTKISDTSETNTSNPSTPNVKSAIEDKRIYLQESPCPRIEKVLNERRASLKEENPILLWNTVRNKGKDEPEKDEGFEETQSQLSEVASQEAGSNYDTDLADSPRSIRQTKSPKPDKLPINQENDSPDTSLEIVKSNENESAVKEEKKSINSVMNHTIGKRNSFARSTLPIARSLPVRQNSQSKQAISALKVPQKFVPMRSNSIRSRNVPNYNEKAVSKQNNQSMKSTIVNKHPIVKDQKHSSSRRNSQESVYSVGSRSKSPAIRGSRLNKIDSSPKIGRRVAGYTKAINSMTNNLRGGKPFENYDVTQSMPPTPSDEHKTFMSSLKASENSKKTRSSSSVHNPRSQSRRSSERSLNGSFGLASRKGSEKSLSRKSSDRSLNLSRKSSETSVITVKSANKRIPMRPKLASSPQANGVGHTKSASTNRAIVAKNRPVPPKSASQTKHLSVPTSISKPIARSNSSTKQTSSTVRPNVTVRRTSSDKSCGFMKATSASSAKSAPTKSSPDQSHRTPTRSPLIKVESSTK